jgi:hypothetical protein
LSSLPLEALIFFSVGLLTFFELDRAFYVPKAARKRVWFYWSSFCAINGGLAAILLWVFWMRVDDWGWWARVLAFGPGFMALMRTRVVSVRREEIEIPIGLELLHRELRDFFYRRINEVCRSERFKEADQLARSHSLKDLLIQARMQIRQDALLTDEEKADRLEWLLKIQRDRSIDEREKKLIIADFILSGRM